MVYLISACLLGLPCRYDGRVREVSPAVERLAKEHTLIPVCPEVLGGLPTPRPPAERQGERIVNAEGVDVTAAYRRGAEEVLRLCRHHGADGVILKDMSPSCGTNGIYDGSFTRTRVPGLGVTAELLLSAGVTVLDEGGAPPPRKEK